MAWWLWVLAWGGWVPPAAVARQASEAPGVPCGHDGGEPNDERHRARPIEEGRVGRTCAGDVDWFVWTATRPGAQRLRLERITGGPAPARVEVFAPRKRKGRTVRPDRWGGLQFRAPKVGRYRLRVVGEGPAAYRLGPPLPPPLPDDAPAAAQ